MFLGLFVTSLVWAQDTPLAFTTGVKGRAVRIELRDRPNEEVTHGEAWLLEAGFYRARDVLHHLGRPRSAESRLATDVEWRVLLTLGAWLKILAVDTDAREVAELRRGSLVQLARYIHPNEVDVGDDPRTLARLFVRPFRDNWLYAAPDAATLNAVEDRLATNLWRGRLRDVTHTPEMLRRLSEDELRVLEAEYRQRVADIGTYLTRFGNAGVNYDDIRRLARVPVADARDVLLRAVSAELRHVPQDEADPYFIRVALETLAEFASLSGPSREAFEDLCLNPRLGDYPFGITVRAALTRARVAMLGRAAELPSWAELFANARGSCAGRLRTP